MFPMMVAAQENKPNEQTVTLLPHRPGEESPQRISQQHFTLLAKNITSLFLLKNIEEEWRDLTAQIYNQSFEQIPMTWPSAALSTFHVTSHAPAVARKSPFCAYLMPATLITGPMALLWQSSAPALSSSHPMAVMDWFNWTKKRSRSSRLLTCQCD